MQRYYSISSLTCFFALLWLPLGQHDFLIQHWMKVGTFMAPALLFMALSESRKKASGIDFRIMSVVMLVLYIVHQFEEHWLDAFGNYYAFHGSINTLIASALGQNDPALEVLTPLSIFVINTSLVWLVGFSAIQCSQSVRFPALAMNGIILVNAITHIMAAIAQQAYNPGTLTSVLLFMPFSIYFYRTVLAKNMVPRKQFVWSLAWAFFAHVIMVGGLIGANYLHYYPESVYLAALVIWSLLPLLAIVLERKDRPNKAIQPDAFGAADL